MTDVETGAGCKYDCPEVNVTRSGENSNQARLNNGCVCDSGCESCARLAEAFVAMRAALHDIVYGVHALRHEATCRWNSRLGSGCTCGAFEVYERGEAALRLELERSLLPKLEEGR